MFTKLIDALKATRRTIVFTEGPDARILEAADRLIKDDLMNVILIGNVDEVKAAAEKGGFDIAKAEIIDPATYAGMDEMVQKMVELRKGKIAELPIENLSMARETRIVYNRDFDHPEILQEITKTYQEVARMYR